MKVKLKKGEHLSSMDNYCNLLYEDWLALEQGKTIELKEINKFIKDKIETTPFKYSSVVSPRDD